MGTESKIGTGLAFVGLAVAMGGWLIPPETISYNVRFVFVLIAIGFVLVGIVMIFPAAWQWFLGLSADQTKPECSKPEGYISVHEAVRRLHDAAKQGKIPMMGAETMSGGTGDNPKPGSEEDIYTWWAIRIAKDEDIEMCGRKPPSGNLEKLSRRIKREFLFADKATKLKDPMADNVYFTDLCVKEEDLIKSYYFESGFHQG
jgi:hypothetical protein